MKTRLWNVCLNGRLPALRQFQTFNEAALFVAAETGENVDRVRVNNEAGCPTMCGDNEYDIEKARSE